MRFGRCHGTPRNNKGDRRPAPRDWADSLGEQVPNRIIEAMAKLDAARAVDPLPDAQLKANIAAPPRYPRGTE